ATASGLTLWAHLWIDTWWVGQLDAAEAALAALSIATFTRWVFSSVASLVGTGLTALVARYVGAGRLTAAAYVGFQGIIGALLLSVVVAVIGYGYAPVVFDLVSDDQRVIEAGVVYVRIFWVGGSTVLLGRAAEAVFRARGNTTITFVIALAGLGINAVLDPMLMFGWWGMPKMGVAGVSLATVIGAGITTLFSLAVLVRLNWISTQRPSDDQLRLHDKTLILRPILGCDVSIYRRIARVGLPAAYSGVFFSVIYLFISKIVAETGGTDAQAALGIGHRGESVAFMVCLGFSAAAASIVGRKLGEENPQAAHRAAWRATIHCAIISAVWAGVMFFFGDVIVSLIVSEGPTRSYAVSYYAINAIAQVPQAVELVLEGAFGGAGMTMPPMIITVVLSAIRIPIAYYLTKDFGMGVEAIWWALALTATLRGVAMAIWFQRGTWMRANV
ncbi:MAG: MATE family efflux transporter, partial [Planctomycetota bacterium]